MIAFDYLSKRGENASYKRNEGRRKSRRKKRKEDQISFCVGRATQMSHSMGESMLVESPYLLPPYLLTDDECVDIRSTTPI